MPAWEWIGPDDESHHVPLTGDTPEINDEVRAAMRASLGES